MRTYVDLTFSTAGTNPTVAIDRLQTLAHVTLLTGEHDIVFRWDSVEEFRSHITAIHNALAGTGVRYRLRTEAEKPLVPEPGQWPPSARDGEQVNPAYPTRDPRRASVERIR
jgi:hypothetical protein